MTSVLLIGIVPDAVNVADPDLPPGTTHEIIAAGIDAALADMRGRGWHAEFCGILPDDTAEATIARSLGEQHWNCIVVGGGIRVPARGLELFERVVNAAREGAPETPIAFNTRPENTGDAAARWIR